MPKVIPLSVKVPIAWKSLVRPALPALYRHQPSMIDQVRFSATHIEMYVIAATTIVCFFRPGFEAERFKQIVLRLIDGKIAACRSEYRADMWREIKKAAEAKKPGAHPWKDLFEKAAESREAMHANLAKTLELKSTTKETLPSTDT